MKGPCFTHFYIPHRPDALFTRHIQALKNDNTHVGKREIQSFVYKRESRGQTFWVNFVLISEFLDRYVK